MLTQLTEYCGLNLGGVVVMEYASLEMIDKSSYIPIYSSGNLQYNILFSQGDWLSMPARPGSIDWEQTQDRSGQGPFYAQTLRAVLPHMRVAVEEELEKMAHHAYLLRISDKNNRTWLIGTPDHPFYFRADSATGEANGFNNYEVRFESRTPYRAKGFTPVFLV